MSKSIFESDLNFIYTKCANELELLSGKTIFVTGGTGFFGKWLLETINYANLKLERPIKLHVLTRSPEKFSSSYPHILNSNITLIKGSLNNFELQESCEYFLHAAADVASTLSNNTKSDQVKDATETTQYILNKVKNSSIKNFLFTSSGAVYGSKNSSMSPSIETETLGISETSAYGEAKIACEKLLTNEFKDTELNLVIARCFAFTGAHLPTDTTFATGNFIANLLNDENIIIKGDGSPQRTFMYMADLCIWLIKLFVKNKGIEIVNVGSDEVVDIEQLANEISSFNKKCDVEILETRKNGPVPSYVPNIKKAKDEFGLVNYFNFKDSISKTIDWFMQ